MGQEDDWDLWSLEGLLVWPTRLHLRWPFWTLNNRVELMHRQPIIDDHFHFAMSDGDVLCRGGLLVVFALWIQVLRKLNTKLIPCSEYRFKSRLMASSFSKLRSHSESIFVPLALYAVSFHCYAVMSTIRFDSIRSPCSRFDLWKL